MTDLPDIDLLVTAADNPDQIAPPAAKEVRPVRVVTRLHERGETVCSSNVYELVAEAIKVKAKSYLQQVRACVSNDRLHIETAFGQPPATIIGSAKRLDRKSVV